jgi:hypothetical protein
VLEGLLVVEDQVSAAARAIRALACPGHRAAYTARMLAPNPIRALFLGLLLAAVVAPAREPPETTEDGLVRVPSNSRAGVYRAPGVPFDRYQRVIIGATIPIEFRKNWLRTHREVTPQEVEKIRGDFARAFRTELDEELVQRGGFAVAAEPATDVIRIDAAVTDFDLAAPNAGNTPLARTYTRQAGSMKVVIEMRDAASGVLIGRIISYEQAREYPDPQPATQVSNLAELRIGFANAARYTREAINVAKTEKPRPQGNRDGF